VNYPHIISDTSRGQKQKQPMNTKKTNTATTKNEKSQVLTMPQAEGR
jgi:hypothetical protein